MIGTDAKTGCECLVRPNHVLVCLTGAAEAETVTVLRDALETAALINPHLPVVVDLRGLGRVTPDALAQIQVITDRAVAGGAQLAISGPALAAVTYPAGAA